MLSLVANFPAAMFVAPFGTMLTRKYGMHVVVLTGALLQCGGFVAASFATQVVHLYIT
jgi:hypothetical protein